MTINKSCMNCSKFMGCLDTKKGHMHVCKLHFYAPSADKLWLPEEQSKLTHRANTAVVAGPTELDLEKVLDEIYDTNNRVMRDLRVDDRDIKEFPNFWDFTFSNKGLDAPLFSRQLFACLSLFHEICPTCSNPKYMKHIKDVPVDIKAKNFPEHFQLMEYGVCPKCKRSKLDHFRERTMNPYQELAGLAGQRVGKSLITAASGAYLTHKILKLQDPSKVYGILNTTLVGTFVGLTYNASYEQLWLPYKGFLDNSPWFCIEESTPISMADGSTKAIRDVAVGDQVLTLEGQSVVDNVFDNGVQDVWEIELEDGTTLRATAEHKVRCQASDGTLFWKTVGELTDEDMVVTLQ